MTDENKIESADAGAKVARPAWRMPAEWEGHAATWIAWPHNRKDWPGKFGPIPWVYADIVRRLTQGERVRICVVDSDQRKDAEKKLRRAGADLNHVEFHKFPTDRVWTRDSAGSFVTRVANGRTGMSVPPTVERALVGWKFNAWAKYDDWKKDRKLPGRIAEALGLPLHEPMIDRDGARRLVLEGGAIDVNGSGTLLTTEECLMSEVQARNPGLTKADYERVFAEHLGVAKVIWLGAGIVGDDTHGHVDDLARFVDPTTVVTVVEHDTDDPNCAPLRENLERLKAATDQDGHALRVVELPMPEHVVFHGQLLPASYANFYIGNSVVLVPTFDDPADRIALGTLADLFPGRSVVGVRCRDLVWGLGTLHCMTQQEPLAQG